MKAVLIGILPAAQIRERILALACGRQKRNVIEPKIWFRSMESLVDALGNERRAMRRELILKMKPASVADLSEIAGRDLGDLSEGTKVSSYGIVELRRELDEVQLVAVTTGLDLVER